MTKLLSKSKKYFPGKPKYFKCINIKYKRKINSLFVKKIYNFINISIKNISKLDLNNVVIGMSGGLDSTVMALLCKNALGKKRVTAVIIDLGLKEHKEQTTFTINIAKKLDINYVVIKSPKIVKDYYKTIKKSGPFTEINIITRAIHNLIFQYADSKMAAVVSTVDKSEFILGRHMEYFYGHFAPLFNLYKTEIYDLARYLNIPQEVIDREPGCFEAWFDKDIFGVSYDDLDPILYLMGKKVSVETISKNYIIDLKWLKKIEYRFRNQNYRMITSNLKI